MSAASTIGRAKLYLAALVVLALAWPAVAYSQSDKSDEAELDRMAGYRLTDATFKKFVVVTHRLAALCKTDPTICEQASEPKMPAKAGPAFAGTGTNWDEWRTFLGAMTAAGLIEAGGVDAETPAVVRSNIGFLHGHAGEVKALHPDLQVVMHAGEK